ncbi:MAG: DUF433 domain-containing protein [Spirosoma sp.]|nr:DUF433 domain-containing protein [Spirosoma sp.]
MANDALPQPRRCYRDGGFVLPLANVDRTVNFWVQAIFRNILYRGYLFRKYVRYAYPRFPRITVDAETCAGSPCIRGMRFPVSSLLDYLSSGMTYDELLAEFTFLEKDDILQALSFSSEQVQFQIFPLQQTA